MTDTIKTKRPRRASGSASAPRTSEVSSCVDGAASVAEELKDEMAEWQSSLECNSMEHLPKYDEVTEAVDALEALTETLQSLDCPEFLTDVPASYTQDTRQSANSRRGRLENAESELQGAVCAVEQWLDENPEIEGDEERDTQREEAQTFLDEMQSAADEFGNVCFPGMY